VQEVAEEHVISGQTIYAWREQCGTLSQPTSSGGIVN
jgi:hypothetical protein